MKLFLLFVVLLLLEFNVGQQHLFLQKYKGAIENYIMTGREKGWRGCNILSENTFSNEGIPQIIMDIKKIKALNLKLTFSSFDCLLVIYDVNSKDSLSALFEFGWAAVDHVRLALMIKMGSDITLDRATNTSKLPYLVAAETDEGKEQFLCPVIGESKPRLEQEMCKPSYASSKKKKLRIALAGLPPNVVHLSNGTIEGTTMSFIKMLAKRLRFIPEIMMANSFIAADDMVC